MRVILDGSICFDRFNAASKYYAQMLPRLSAQAGIEVEWIPSPTAALSAPDQVRVRAPLTPSGKWFPQGQLKSWLSRKRRHLESWLWRLREVKPSSDAVLFHTFLYTLPSAPGMKHVQMLLDMILEKFPDVYQAEEEKAMRARKRQALGSAARIIAISEQSKRDLCEIYGFDPQRIDVVYLAVDSTFYSTPAAPGDLPPGLDRPFFLQVGGRLNHKNFSRLLEAYALGKFASQVQLLCAGEPWDADEWEKICALGLQDSVTTVVKPSEIQLRALYQRARGLVYPSLYEGFGLPPLEAMASGAPVAASRAASIPEVVGEAAILFDPWDVAAMAKSMEELLHPETRSRLVEAGQTRAAQFHWDRTVRETVEVYRKALS